MNKTEFENLCKAYCKLNTWEWDDYIGEKPNEFI